MNEVQESIKIVEWLRSQLQHTDKFSSKMRAMWVRELNALIREIKMMDYVEVKPDESMQQAEERVKRQGLSLNKLKKV